MNTVNPMKKKTVRKKTVGARASTKPASKRASKRTTKRALKHSTNRAALLIELGVEELPARGQDALARAFAAGLAQQLVEAGVIDDAQQFQFFASPRRLAALLPQVAARQAARVVETRGPSVQAAFDEHGKPTAAARGFANSCGVAVAQLQTLATEQGERLTHRARVRGATLTALLDVALGEALRRLPIAKRMRWGDGDAEFIRPVRWVTALHGKQQLTLTAFGLRAARVTHAHRLCARQTLSLPDAEQYARVLFARGKVIADFARRRAVIDKQLAALAKRADAQPPNDEQLLDEVTGLVEWPNALCGEFDKRFLTLPPQVLVSAMRDHQKYFHLRDARGKLLPKFIAVANLDGDLRRVRRGNERVLRARLADAEFFWRADLRAPLESRADQLARVLFHQQLGSLADKTARIERLAGVIGAQLDAEPTHTARAAQLCKLDLLTDMVGEFPELQGVIGRHCALAYDEARAVADAIEQHYLPRTAGDALPRGAVAQSVALADRLDSLLGLFSAGDAPSGDKDPFALRRAALAVLRILIEKKLALALPPLLNEAAQGYRAQGIAVDDDIAARVFAFMLERLRAYYAATERGAQALPAVLARRPSKPLDVDLRIKALVHFFAKQPTAAASLAAANKRIANLLNKAKQNGEPIAEPIDSAALSDEAERDLARQLQKVDARARDWFAAGDYRRGLTELAQLAKPIDAFFEQVMVMDNDATKRANRLALLLQIRRLFFEVADISKMAVERPSSGE